MNRVHQNDSYININERNTTVLEFTSPPEVALEQVEFSG
jgi:hypothetical protein